MLFADLIAILIAMLIAKQESTVPTTMELLLMEPRLSEHLKPLSVRPDLWRIPGWGKMSNSGRLWTLLKQTGLLVMPPSHFESRFLWLVVPRQGPGSMKDCSMKDG